MCIRDRLILDDFGMERGTEYGLEQVFNVIDSRYRSGKPLIVTTNLTLEMCIRDSPEAVNAVLLHYAGYIRYFSKVNGQVNAAVEDYVKQRLIDCQCKFRLDEPPDKS